MTDPGSDPVRVYIPADAALLRSWRESGSIDVDQAHAVTDALASAIGGADDEEVAWAALTTAAQASLALSAGGAQRLVLVVDARGVTSAQDGDDPTRVRLAFPAAWKRAAAIHADLPEAADAVTAARQAYASGDEQRGDQLAVACLDHELGWFGVQELDDLLA